MGGGVIAMTMTMARECASRGVTVNAVAPGFIASDMTAELPAEIVEGVMKNIPLGRFGEPEEVAGLVKYLALDPSSLYITGHCINIDGGVFFDACKAVLLLPSAFGKGKLTPKATPGRVCTA